MTKQEKYATKLLKWIQRAMDATTREEAQKIIRKANKFQRKLNNNQEETK